MDLDSFQADYRAFKARVMPMLLAWEQHQQTPEDKAAAIKLDTEIRAPLTVAEDATDEQKAAAEKDAEASVAREKLATEAARQAAMSDEEKAALAAEINKPLPPPPADDPTIRPIVKPEPTTIALRPDGPTVAEWVAKGYPAKAYPPAGYASKSTPEEIAAAVKADEVKAAQDDAQKHPAGVLRPDPALQPNPALQPQTDPSLLQPQPQPNPASQPNEAPLQPQPQPNAAPFIPPTGPAAA